MSPALRSASLVVLLTTVTLAGCLAGVDPSGGEIAPPPTDGDLVTFEKIHTPTEITAQLEELGTLDAVDVEPIGESVEGRPLHRVVVGDGPHELWIVGRQHGNEPTGAEAILQAIAILGDPDARVPAHAPPILHTLREHRDVLRDRVTFIFVPVGNPDGSAAFERSNANNQDLNRDHWLFTEPESQAMRDAFWEFWPDSCIDLHNEGLSERYDYDAFMPDRLPESEMQRSLVRNAWQSVYEVDAAGGFGGGPNENYVVTDEPVRIVNPTTFHPGTHDMFCSLRGAPGWTPEGAIPGSTGSPHPDTAAYNWSTRLHAVTVATEALSAAGMYTGHAEPYVHKEHRVLDAGIRDAYVDVPEDGDARIQVVWRQKLPKDKNPAPVRVTVEDPEGVVHDARKPFPDAFSATVDLPDARKGTYRVHVEGPPTLEHEIRVYLDREEPERLLVQRTRDALRVEDRSGLGPRVVLSDVVGPDVDVDAYDPAPDRVRWWNGTVGDRRGLVWTLDLAPGETVRIDTPHADNPGPFRWTASAGEKVWTGVEARRSTE